MLEQALQLLGGAAVLAAFALVRVGRMGGSSWPYLWLNLTGGALLAVLAALGGDLGFLMLEGSWAIVSAVGVVQKARLDTRPEGG